MSSYGVPGQRGEFDPNFHVGLIESPASSMLRQEYLALEAFNLSTIEDFDPDGPITSVTLRTESQSELESAEPLLTDLLRINMYSRLGVALTRLDPDMDPDYIHECHYRDGVSIDQVRYIMRADGVRIPVWIASGVGKEDSEEYYEVTLLSNEQLVAELERIAQLEHENELDQQLHDALALDQSQLDEMSLHQKQQRLADYERTIEARLRTAGGQIELTRSRQRWARVTMPALRLLDHHRSTKRGETRDRYEQAVGNVLADEFSQEPRSTTSFLQEEQDKRLELLNNQWNLRRMAAIIRSVTLSGGAGIAGLAAGLQDGKFNYVLGAPPLREGILFGTLALLGVGYEQAHRTKRMFSERRRFMQTSTTDEFDPLGLQLDFEDAKAEKLRHNEAF